MSRHVQQIDIIPASDFETEAINTVPKAKLGHARIAVSGTFFILGCSISSWLSRLPALQHQHHVNSALLSLALLSCSIGAVCAMPLSVPLCSRFGSSWVTTASLTLLCLSFPFVACAPNFVCFCLDFFVLGLVSSVATVNMNSHAVLVERLYGRSIMSSLHGFFSTGSITGALVGSLAASCGMLPPHHYIWISIALLLLAWIANTFLLPAALDQRRAFIANEPRQKLQRKQRFRPEPAVIGLGVIALCALISEGAMADWSGIYLRNSLHTSEGFAALGYASFNATMCLGRFTGDAITQRIGPALTVRSGALFAAIGLSIALIAGNPIAALLGFAAVGLGFSTICPVVYSAAGKSSANASAAIAIVAMIGYAGLMSGPPIIGVTAALTGLASALGLVCLCALVIAALADFVKMRPTSPAVTVAVYLEQD